MTKSRSRVVLLCEDVEHGQFFRRLLRRKLNVGYLRVEILHGAAMLLQHYAKEVKLARSVQARGENYVLVVAIDGDRFKLQERLRHLDQELVKAKLPTRGPDEAIVICVPTRNVETWELWLCGDREVDENGDFKHRFRDAGRRGEASAKLAVQGWFELSSEERHLETTRLPALAAGRKEVDHLDQLS